MYKKLSIMLVLCIILTGCGNINDKQHSEIINSEQQDKFVALDKKDNIEIVQTPVPGDSFFDTMYNKNKDNDTTQSDDKSYKTEEFPYDLSFITYDEIKDNIIKIYYDNNYESCEIQDYYDDSTDGIPTTTCVVKMDSDYWIVNYSEGKAYALKDELGIFLGNYDLGLDKGEQ